VKPIKVDLAGIEARIVALPLPAADYVALAAGKKGSIYFLENTNPVGTAVVAPTLSRWLLEDRKTEKLADHVESFQISADGEKMLLAISNRNPESTEGGGPPSWVIVPANAPVKPGEGNLSFADLKVHVDPAAEWMQMYHEVWRIERSYFYDPHFHGTDTVADERRFRAVCGLHRVPRRPQLHLSGDARRLLRRPPARNGGTIPTGPHVPGGLLGADYTINNNRYCLAKIYTGGKFNPRAKAPLAQPGLNVSVGDCISPSTARPRRLRRHSEAARRHRRPRHQPSRRLRRRKKPTRHLRHSHRQRSHCAISTGSKATMPYSPSLDVTSLDRTVDPCVDFYKFSCGGWRRTIPSPPTRPGGASTPSWQ
jgi:hypothetical protein